MIMKLLLLLHKLNSFVIKLKIKLKNILYFFLHKMAKNKKSAFLMENLMGFLRLIVKFITCISTFVVFLRNKLISSLLKSKKLRVFVEKTRETYKFEILMLSFFIKILMSFYLFIKLFFLVVNKTIF